jgi:hypothetical protein
MVKAFKDEPLFFTPVSFVRFKNHRKGGHDQVGLVVAAPDFVPHFLEKGLLLVGSRHCLCRFEGSLFQD